MTTMVLVTQERAVHAAMTTMTGSTPKKDARRVEANEPRIRITKVIKLIKAADPKTTLEKESVGRTREDVVEKEVHATERTGLTVALNPIANISKEKNLKINPWIRRLTRPRC